MTLPAIISARRFDAAAHAPFFIGDERVGWIRRTDVDALRRWPDVFEIDETSVRLNASLADVNMRSAALGAVIGALFVALGVRLAVSVR